MGKRTLKLILVANFSNGDEGIYKVQKIDLPSFKKADVGDAEFEEFIKSKIDEIKEALSDYEYEQSLPEPGMASGCW